MSWVVYHDDRRNSPELSDLVYYQLDVACPWLGVPNTAGSALTGERHAK